MDLATAQALPLMGRPESWNGYGRTRLEGVPDGVLRQARRFFMEITRAGTGSPRVDEQLEAIALILADREAHSPQQSLSL